MQNKITASIVIFIAIFVVGFGAYWFFNNYRVIGKNTDATFGKMIDFFDSGLITDLNGAIRGEVLDIKGRTLALDSPSGPFSVDVEDGVSVVNLLFDWQTKKNSYQEARFDDIKVGDEISVGFFLRKNSLLIGNIVILPKTDDVR